MKGQNLPDEHHVIRVVPFTKLETDGEGRPTGRVLFSAFQRRETEEGLSVTWLEYFAGDRPVQIVRAVHAIRASNFKPSPKSAFAIGGVGPIKQQCVAKNHKIRIIHDPVDDNKAHAELRQFPRDDVALLEALATSGWSELVFNAAVAKGEAPAPDVPAAEL
jgi:hypothetical protein